MKKRTSSLAFALIWLAIQANAQQINPETQAQGAASNQRDIKAYCLDFNWVATTRRGKPFAKPGSWAAADPAQHVAWYKAMGANVIQTFCVSTNGYAWYKNGFIPEQPGLKHDFLPEVVKLGHEEGMLVFGYFCASANPKWGTDHPDLSYGTPTTYHIPYTDAYLDYLSKSISDAVSKTGIDGFMVDWLWMPNRKSTDGKWLDCEKELYKQLMGADFPGEEALTKAQDLAYSRKAINRCWQTIRKAAERANPDCIIWLTVNNIRHPHAINSDMYKEADWLMNEAGSLKAIDSIRNTVGQKTRLITCMAAWNGADAVETVPQALAAGVGLYGFTAPRNGAGLVPLENIFSQQINQLTGDSRNIAVLARIYHGVSVDAVWKDGQFVEPDVPPPFRIRLAGRGRGLQDTASLTYTADVATVTVTTPYAKGKGWLTRKANKWPAKLTVQFQRRNGEASAATAFKMANGSIGLSLPLDSPEKVTYVPADGKNEIETQEPVSVARTDAIVEVVVPNSMIAENPESLSFEWIKE